MNRKGQVLIEHLIVLLTLILPLTAGIIRWGMLEYRRTRCAHAAFQQARRMLILEDRETKVVLACESGISESIRLAPLRDLQSPDPALSIRGWVGQASSLWEDLSRYSSSSSEPGLD
jgi:hypothetical protein